MIKERKDIPQKYQWDLSVIYPTEAEFAKDYDVMEKRIRAFAAHEATMAESGEGLYNALSEQTAISDLLGKLWQYASLGFSMDLSNPAAQARQTRVRNLYILFGEVGWFVSPRLLALEDEALASFYAEYPKLSVFRRRIYRSRRYRPHVLSDESEQLLSQVDGALETHSNIYSILTNSDLRFGNIRGEDGKITELSASNYVTIIKSRDRRVRRAAFRRMYRVYAQYANTVSALYEARVKEAVVDAKIRKYADSITASTYGDEVTPEIYNKLIDAVHHGLPALYEYYKLKKDILGLKQLHLYDIYTPLIGENEKECTYEEAIDEVLAAVAPLGENYVKDLKEGLTERGWVDVYPTRGKRGGAFSTSGAYTEPYILINFNGTENDVSTLAHEAGHSMHSLLSQRSNPSHDSHPTIFVAEVASTVNELLLAHKRLAECQDIDGKLSVLNELIEQYKGTLYRQTMFAEFERDMHAMCEAGTPLTRETLCGHYHELNRLYFGPDVVADEEISYEWARIPHFYSCFYVYKYATCISAASAIVKRIESEGAPYVEKYLGFLSAGGSMSPLDSLLLAEIDMKDPAVVESAIQDFAAAVADFRALYQEKNK